MCRGFISNDGEDSKDGVDRSGSVAGFERAGGRGQAQGVEA